METSFTSMQRPYLAAGRCAAHMLVTDDACEACHMHALALTALHDSYCDKLRLHNGCYTVHYLQLKARKLPSISNLALADAAP